MKCGTLRARLEDFFVDEVVPPRSAQEGEHLHIRIEKRGLSTEEAIKRLARHFGVSPAGVGRCGRKDVRAVARQWLSFAGVRESQLDSFRAPDIALLEWVRLPRKLRMGRFLGNRFRLRVRDLSAEQAQRAMLRLETVRERGLPNAFGEQRLGAKGDNATAGQWLLQGRLEEALELILAAGSGQRIERMRECLERGQPQEALKILGRRRAGFLVSAWQASLFNRLLRLRAACGAPFLEGDLFFNHDSGRLVSIDDLELAAQRVGALVASPTGPLPGPNMPQVSGAALEVESEVLRPEFLVDTAQRRWFGCRGTRRPLRVPVTETRATPGGDDLGPYLELAFRLPPGSFATSLVETLLE